MLTTVPSPGASRAPRSQVGSKHLYAVTCAAVLLLALYTPVSTGIAFGGVQPLRLAVLDFSAASANPLDAPLGKGLQAMLTTDLATIPLIQLVERDRLNDIRDELKLSRGKLIDKATAVRIGKLINASYLLTGTYTVVGARMRVDCRLFAVGTGKILLAEKVEGERDAFFELQKQLGKQVIGALQLKLTPKQRARVARIHTADFDAFRSFSRGIQLFDEKKFQRATEALRLATEKDSEFKLAAITLAQYERIIADLNTRAGTIESTRDELKRRGEKAKKEEHRRIRDRLLAMAQGKGTATRLQQAAALYLLVDPYQLGGGLPEQAGDGSHPRRRRAAYCRAYYELSQKLFPAVPLFVGSRLLKDPPRSGVSFKGRFDRAMAVLSGKGDPEPVRVEELLNNLQLIDQFAACLQLDHRQAVELQARAYRLGCRLIHRSKFAGRDSMVKSPTSSAWKPPSYTWRENRGLSLARAYRQIRDLSRSTALLTKLSRSCKIPEGIRRFIREIKTNHKLAKILAKHPRSAYLRESLFSGLNDLSYPERLITSPQLSGMARQNLDELRRLDKLKPPYIYLGKHLIYGPFKGFSTGPRTDLRRTDELRYSSWTSFKAPRLFRNKMLNYPPVLVVDGRSLDDLSMSFEIVYTWPGDMGPVRVPRGVSSRLKKRGKMPRPAVGVLLGIRDLYSWKKEKVRGRLQQVKVPTTARVVVVDPARVLLAEISQIERGSLRNLWRFKELGASDVDLHKVSKVKVSIRVRGTSVVVQLDGKAHRFKTSGARRGLYGLTFIGMGFVAIRDLKCGNAG